MFSLPGSGASDSLEQQVYLATFDTIRHIALQGPCVIIGRCADYALEDFPSKLRLFISAPLEQRIETVMTRENLPKEKAKAMIVKTDKRRASYYEYYSFQKWGNVESYDFIMLLSGLGIITHKVSRVLLAGGGKVSFYLAQILQKSGVAVQLIEQDKDRCLLLAGLLPKTCIVHGDASSFTFLESEGFSGFDALVTLTGLDELNMSVTMVPGAFLAS